MRAVGHSRSSCENKRAAPAARIGIRDTRARRARRLHAAWLVVLRPRGEPRALQGPRLRHAEGARHRRNARQPAERADRAAAASLGVNIGEGAGRDAEGATRAVQLRAPPASGSGAHSATERFNVAAGREGGACRSRALRRCSPRPWRPHVRAWNARGVFGMGLVKDGKVKPLAVSTRKRVAGAARRVPTSWASARKGPEAASRWTSSSTAARCAARAGRRPADIFCRGSSSTGAPAACRSSGSSRTRHQPRSTARVDAFIRASTTAQGRDARRRI